MAEEEEVCRSYCSHGGVCALPPGHEPPHDSKYCRWTDEEALTKAEADEILAGKPGGAEYLQETAIQGAWWDVELP